MKNENNFIMLPTVDVCFGGLMENAKVRKGFVAAILRMNPDGIEGTELLPTHLAREFADDKLGILDVRVRLKDGTQMNLEMQVNYFEYWDERVIFYTSKMFFSQLKKGEPYSELQKCIHVSILDFIHFPEDEECYRTIHLCDEKTGKVYSDKLEIQILELKKLPKEVKSGVDVIRWMKFFSGKSRKEFEDMAKTNEYLEEAYDTLMKLSADEQKRREYELREKEIMDHNWRMNCMKKQGLEEGRKEGLKEGRKEGLKEGRKEGLKEGRKEGLQEGLQAGIQTAKQVFRLSAEGKQVEEIAEVCSLSIEEVKKILI